jgi:succinyl-CoA synthetase beta subunit
MNLREYQAKRIFAEHGIPVPRGRTAMDPGDVEEIACELGCPVVLKPQLGVKKRGKLGLIAFSANPVEAAKESERLFGRIIMGEPIRTILVEEKADIARELYVAVVVDYSRRCPMIMVSRKGGVDVEGLAKEEPGSLLKLPIDILKGPTPGDTGRIAEFTGEDMAKTAEDLYSIFREYDAETIEINPTVRTKEGKLLAVDAVLNVNDDSLFRHPELESLRKGMGDVDPIALEATANRWTYIDLPGDIAILSSGAGLTMTILDLIGYAGGEAANFLDTAQIDEDGIYGAFELLVRAKEARAMLINIFAGLNRCDRLAEGIVRYLTEHPIEIPIVVRMIGNKEEEGHGILRDFGIEPQTDLETAVEQVVDLSRGEAGVR